MAAAMEQRWTRCCFSRGREGEERSMPEEFQNLAIGGTVKEVITFCSIGEGTNQLQNRVIQIIEYEIIVFDCSKQPSATNVICKYPE